jgi:hypothetical protein
VAEEFPLEGRAEEAVQEQHRQPVANARESGMRMINPTNTSSLPGMIFAMIVKP